MCFQEDFNEDRIVFVCFVCAREEKLTGEGKERRLLLKEMSAASFEKSRLELVGTLQGHSWSVGVMIPHLLISEVIILTAHSKQSYLHIIARTLQAQT